MVSREMNVPVTVRILLAEDNSVNQEVIGEMLQSIGCQVQVVSNGQQALDALKDKAYDMIFMDCQMPVMDGHEASIRIRSIQRQKGWKHIPIIGITGRSIRANYEKSEKASMDGLLDKPFTIEQLKDTIFQWTGIRLQDNITTNREATLGAQNDSTPLSNGRNTDCLDLMVIDNIYNLGNGSKVFLKKIINIFVQHVPHLISEIHRGIHDKNTEKIFQAAHSLKSSSANIGAMPLSAMCQALESEARQKMIDGAPSQITLIESEYAKVVSALNRIVNEIR